MAAVMPRKTMATENIHTTELVPQSSALLATMPSSFTKAGLKMLQEYTEPMQRCMATETRGIFHLLKSGGAMMRSFRKKGMGAEAGTSVTSSPVWRLWTPSSHSPLLCGAAGPPYRLRTIA